MLMYQGTFLLLQMHKKVVSQSVWLSTKDMVSAAFLLRFYKIQICKSLRND